MNSASFNADRKKSQREQPAPINRAAMKVLVVSVERAIGTLCRVNLEAEGIDVSEAADGPSALEKARERMPDVMLLGIMLPVRDGLSVAQELRDDPRTKGIPIIFNSARWEFCECVWELDLPDVDCLPLPFNPVELASFLTYRVREARTRGSSQSRELEDVWSLRAVATTPNDTPVHIEVERWRASRVSRLSSP